MEEYYWGLIIGFLLFAFGYVYGTTLLDKKPEKNKTKAKKKGGKYGR